MNLFRALVRYFFPAPPPPEAKPSRTYDRGLCEKCGQLNVLVRRDGLPAGRWHKCSRPAVVDNTVTVQATDGLGRSFPVTFTGLGQHTPEVQP